MPRVRTALGAKTEKKIAALMARGGTEKSIEKELRAAGITGVSASTIGRRMRELRGAVAPKRVRASSKPTAVYADPDAAPESSDGDNPLPKTPESIPEGTDVSQIDRWLKRAEFVGKTAAIKGDIAAIGQMGRLTSALLEARRKATPPEKPDPKDDPDMGAAAARARALLHKYIDQALGREAP
jgi:hypothetical protein